LKEDVFKLTKLSYSTTTGC